MDLSAKLQVLADDVERQLGVFSRRRRRDKRKALLLQISTVFLSACITVLLGLKVGTRLADQFSNVALALGAAVTVLAAFEVFFKHRELWIIRTVTVRKLEELRRRINYYQAGRGADELKEPEIVGLVSLFEEIVGQDRDAWLDLRRDASLGLPGEKP
jgi:hypothetical protein